MPELTWPGHPEPHRVWLCGGDVRKAAEELVRRVRRVRSVWGRGRCVVLVAKPLSERFGESFIEPMSEGLGGAPVIPVDDGESRKTLQGAIRIFEKLVALRTDRDHVVVAIGGGVLTDLVGFCAAVFKRGLPWISVPTTLVGQVDAGLGGKTGVDFGGGKNLVGAFWNPRETFLAPCLLDTLPEREFRAGLAEVVKTGEAVDVRILDYLERHAADVLARKRTVVVRIVRDCARAKMSVVAEDPTDRGRRAVLNLGHTVGHAIEAAGRFRVWNHGEAVAMGLVVIGELAARYGILGRDERDRVRALVKRLGLVPKRRPEPESVGRFLELDKKRMGNRLMAVWPGPLGHAELKPARAEDLVAEENWSWLSATEE